MKFSYRLVTKVGLSAVLAVFLLTGCGSKAAVSEEAVTEVVDPCGSQRSELDALMQGQMAAFQSKDFKRALSLTSKEFQGMFPLENFQGMISNQYPLLLNHSRIKTSNCQVNEGMAAMVVEVIGSDQQSIFLGYSFIFESDHWAITGATEISGVPSELNLG